MQREIDTMGGGGIIDKCKYSLSNVRVDSRISVTIILV